MSRHPLSSEPEHPVLRCSIEQTSCLKFNGDGSGTLTLRFPGSDTDVATELIKHYRETELLVTFIKAPS